MSRTLITNGKVVNEGIVAELDILIHNDRIEKIASSIEATNVDNVIDAAGMYVMPGMIDDQVHFREPGFEHKGEIKTESVAAVAGGITSYMEMPNTKLTTTDKDRLKDKLSRASQKSLANFAFYFGATNDNLDEIRSLGANEACGIKVFMGSSTGNMLVDDPKILEGIFKEAPMLVVTHCEDTPTISRNEKLFAEKYQEVLPFHHPLIRSEEACWKSSHMAVGLAKQFGTKLHVLHLTTEKELSLFNQGPIQNKQITAEVCVHHLLFDETDYEEKGNLIKCNPSIKKISDRKALQKALANDILDIVATDHAPHTWEEKGRPYLTAPSGLPLVQHALVGALELFHDKVIELPHLVKKFTHNVADRFSVVDRGYLREGYFADIAIVDLNKKTVVDEQEIFYKCQWTPFAGKTLRSFVEKTIVNGTLVWDGKSIVSDRKGQALAFNRV